MIAVLLLAAGSADAQSVSLPSPVYRPGRYVPLRLDADKAGPVVVLGSGIQSVRWEAAGRSSVVVPLLIFRRGGGRVTVNGREIAFDPQPLDASEADPPELTAFWKQVDPLPGAGDETDEDAYAVARLWEPGRSWMTRQWTLIAVIVVVLALGVARHADPKRATRRMIVVAGGLCVAIVWLFPTRPTRRVVPADGRPGWEEVWYAVSAGQTVVEPWTPGLRYVAEAATDGIMRSPTLYCDAAGRPTEIRCTPGGDDHAFWHERLVFSRPRVSSPTPRSE